MGGSSFFDVGAKENEKTKREPFKPFQVLSPKEGYTQMKQHQIWGRFPHILHFPTQEQNLALDSWLQLATCLAMHSSARQSLMRAKAILAEASNGGGGSSSNSGN